MSDLPKHIAVIPDGNRRWAAEKGLSPWEGHKAGADKFFELIDTCSNLGIENLTFWAASASNLTKRPPLEIKKLLEILIDKISNESLLSAVEKNQIKVHVKGQWRELIQNRGLIKGLEHLESRTKHYTKKFLTILLGYDGTTEMLNAVNKLRGQTNQLTELDLRKQLWTGDLPDVDMVIRTGGEPHWSTGFMMWLTANSEFFFTDTLWPDFDKAELTAMLEEYKLRRRKLGT